MWSRRADRRASPSTTRPTCTSASARAPTRSTSTRPRCFPRAQRLHHLCRHRRRHRARFRALRLLPRRRRLLPRRRPRPRPRSLFRRLLRSPPLCPWLPHRPSRRHRVRPPQTRPSARPTRRRCPDVHGRLRTTSRRPTRRPVRPARFRPLARPAHRRRTTRGRRAAIACHRTVSRLLYARAHGRGLVPDAGERRSSGRPFAEGALSRSALRVRLTHRGLPRSPSDTSLRPTPTSLRTRGGDAGLRSVFWPSYSSPVLRRPRLARASPAPGARWS
jgi:hypothetical protein